MSGNIVNQTPFLRTSREYPEEISQLVREVSKSYLDIAGAVNSRTIGLFPVNRPAVTGDSWFLNNARQQTLRQIYQITSFASFNHNIQFSSLTTFSKITGIGFDGGNYYPLPFVFSNPASNVGIIVTPTQVVFSVGGAPPAIVSGFILLEWLSNV